MQSIKDWMESPDVKTMMDNTIGKNLSENFFRDPMRNIRRDVSLFYAPADGIVLYAHEVKADEYLEIKGKNFSLKDMINDQSYNQTSLVVGIFMTSFDVHVNRTPIDAYYLEAKETANLYTHNVSMLMAENDLLEKFGYDKKNLGYLFSNERKISVFYCPEIKGRYYIVQIGDKDVSVIQNWGTGTHLFQGERMGAIRWGSQVDLIIPLGEIKFKTLVKKMDHIEAGLDPIIKIINDWKDYA